MIAFKDLKDVLRITLDWERKLKDFYDVAEVAMRNPESKQVVALLREKLLVKLEHLERIDVRSFGKTEWVRYAPGYRDEELIPVGRIGRTSSPEEIFTHLLEYQGKLKSVYSSIAQALVSRSQKELFEALALFKEEQSAEIGRLLESYKPAKN